MATSDLCVRALLAAGRAVQIMEALRTNPGGVWVDEVCRALGANRTVVRNALAAIEKAGVRLERVRSGKGEHVSFALQARRGAA